MDVTPEHKLKRYLHYGSEFGVYIPGNRFALKSYSPLKFTCAEELFRELKGPYILKTIEEVVRLYNLLYETYFMSMKKTILLCNLLESKLVTFRVLGIVG